LFTIFLRSAKNDVDDHDVAASLAAALDCLGTPPRAAERGIAVSQVEVPQVKAGYS
jgi:hypothetical protein